MLSFRLLRIRWKYKANLLSKAAAIFHQTLRRFCLSRISQTYFRNRCRCNLAPTSTMGSRRDKIRPRKNPASEDRSASTLIQKLLPNTKPERARNRPKSHPCETAFPILCNLSHQKSKAFLFQIQRKSSCWCFV